MAAITFSANVAKGRVSPAVRGRVRARGTRGAIFATAKEGTRAVATLPETGVKRVGAVVGSVAAATAAEPAFAAAHEVAEVRFHPSASSPTALAPTRGTVRLPLSTLRRDRPVHSPSSRPFPHQVAANGVLENLRLFIAIASIALILFQGPKGDGVVNSLNERRVFGSAAETKSAVDYVTAGLIGSFIALSAVLAATQ